MPPEAPSPEAFDDDDDAPSKKPLRWGETPWTNMPQADLLREVQRAYAACVSARSVLRILSANDPSLFWGPGGSGAHALEKLNQVVEPVEAEWAPEDIYRMFFRYAGDLLFRESPGMRLSSGWAVCPACGVMLGRTTADERAGLGNQHIGQPCSYGDPDCPGVFRSLEWSDLEMKEDDHAP